MPASKVIPGDHELAEIYSVSVTHQLHCLVRPTLIIPSTMINVGVGSIKTCNYEVRSS